MTTVLYAALSVVGVTLLTITAVRLLIGGIATPPAGRRLPAQLRADQRSEFWGRDTRQVS